MTKKEIEICFAKVVYSAQFHTRDRSGKIIHTTGHLCSHEIQLKHFPQELQDKIISIIENAEREREARKQENLYG